MTKRGPSVEQAQQIRASKGIEETNLQKMRVKRGFSQNELSIASGVKLRTIQCYEQRTRNIEAARFDTICNICVALHCKIEDVLEDKSSIDKYRMIK